MALILNDINPERKLPETQYPSEIERIVLRILASNRNYETPRTGMGNHSISLMNAAE